MGRTFFVMFRLFQSGKISCFKWNILWWVQIVYFVTYCTKTDIFDY